MEVDDWASGLSLDLLGLIAGHWPINLLTDTMAIFNSVVSLWNGKLSHKSYLKQWIHPGHVRRSISLQEFGSDFRKELLIVAAL